MTAVLLIAAGTTFTSCIFDDSSKTKTWKISRSEDYTGDWYIVKLNETHYDIASEDTGTFSTSSSRSVTTETLAETDETEDFLPESDINYMFHINNRKAFDEIYASLAKDSNSRSASTSYKAEITDERYEVGDTRSFYLYYYTDATKAGNDVVEQTSELIVQGEKCNVWFIDNAKDYVSLSDYPETANLQSIADKFDKLYEYETALLGTNRYTQKAYDYFIDPVEKINIVIADIGDAAGGDTTNGTLGGYFSPTDCYKKGTKYGDGTEITTNGTQVLFMDSYFYKNHPANTFSTIAHEFCHMLNYCQKVLSQNSGGKSLETWLTEMMAMVTEDYFSEFLGVAESATPTASRLPTFNCRYMAGFRNHWSDEYALLSYANTYAFGAYLVRSYCDENLTFLKNLARNEGLDEDAVTLALQSIGEDKTFDDVFTLFPLVLLNAGYETSDTSVPTLYRTAGNTSDSNGMYFHKIDLNSFYMYKSTDSTELVNVRPVLYELTENSALGSYGFSIHKVDQSISDVYYTNNTDGDIGIIYCGNTSTSEE